MTTPSHPAARTAMLAIVALVAIALAGCDSFRGVSAEPLTLSSEQPEKGWTYADADGVSAACPTSWTLEGSSRRNRVWRCSHPASNESPAGCGINIYGDQGAKTLDELVTAMQPEIEAYSDQSELLSSERSNLGDHEAHSFVLNQEIDEEAVRSWYRLALRDGAAWLAHCILPEDYVESDEARVEEIFERIKI